MEETQLTLVVKEKTLGNLVTNALEIKSFVLDRIAEYSVDNYTGDAKQAAKDRAELNKAADKLNSERLALEKEFMKPFAEFKSIVDETKNLIKTASNKLDVIVKAKEQEERDQKYKEIEELWNTKNFELVPLNRVFDVRWYNKTFLLKNISISMDQFIEKTNSDLKAIEDFGIEVENLKAIYLSTLNLQAALSKGAEIKANKERLARIEENKPEEIKNIQIIAREEVKNEIIKPATTSDVKEIIFNMTFNFDTGDVLKETIEGLGCTIIPSYTIKCTLDQAEKVKKFISGIGYSKNTICNLTVGR